jgi:hypothetical protein
LRLAAAPPTLPRGFLTQSKDFHKESLLKETPQASPLVLGAGWRPFLKEMKASLSNPEPQTAQIGKNKKTLGFYNFSNFYNILEIRKSLSLGSWLEAVP